MKLYLLFAGADYYPSGGWDDFVDSFDCIEDAKKAHANNKCGYYEWAHIVDRIACKVVLVYATRRGYGKEESRWMTPAEQELWFHGKL